MSIKVCIGNYGYYNEGELRDAWIELPKPADELMGFLKVHKLYDASHEEIYISDYDGIPFGLDSLFTEYTRLSDLNMLAAQLESTDYDEDLVNIYCKVCGAPHTVVELMNLIDQADEVPYCKYDGKGSSPEDSMGRTAIEWYPEMKAMLDSNPDFDYAFDYERFGSTFDQEYALLDEGYYDCLGHGPRLDRYDIDDYEDKYHEYSFASVEEEEEEAAEVSPPHLLAPAQAGVLFSIPLNIMQGNATKGNETMNEIIDEKYLPGGYKVQLLHASRTPNPRTAYANLGRLYIWSRNISSPDKNPYDDALDFMRGMLLQFFTVDEMIDAIKEGMFPSLHFTGQLEADYSRGLLDAEKLASLIAPCKESPNLVSRKFVLKLVYGVGRGENYVLSTRPIGTAIGFVWASLDDARKALGMTHSSEGELREQTLAKFACEVEEYFCWLNGHVYEVRLVKGADVIDCVEHVYAFDLDDIVSALEEKAELLRSF